jgi:hypothetical protein
MVASHWCGSNAQGRRDRKRVGPSAENRLAVLERVQRRRLRQRQKRAVLLKGRRARVVAFHEAGHAIVAAYLGLMPEQVGREVATISMPTLWSRQITSRPEVRSGRTPILAGSPSWGYSVKAQSTHNRLVASPKPDRRA